MRHLIAAFALVLFVGCNSLATDIENSTVNGTWRGTVSGQTFTISLQQAGQTLAGTGTLVNQGVTKNLSISGNYAIPNLTLTMQSAGDPAISLDGIVEGDSFVGNLTGGSFTTPVAIAMRRD
ncbi:MAG TPA: hypothetical protein VKA54_16335 [Gemmatimonadaceae bacterium]|nr:hypothetical protein [Gemmatimonadaceae bacterium]